jgi:hypothetical protein
MKTVRMLAALLIGLVALGDAPVRACPLRVMFWDVIRQADLVAVARVERIERRKGSAAAPGAAVSGAEEFESDAAVLEIVESWKGSARGAIRVGFDGQLLSEGHRVAVGDQLLVFLVSGEEQIRRAHESAAEWDREPSADEPIADAESDADFEPAAPQDPPDGEWERRWEQSRVGRWFLADAGSGILTVASADLDPLRRLVDQAVRLEEAGPASEEARREWLVQAASVRKTRRNAIRDLLILAGERGPDAERAASPENGLSEGELQSIADGFTGEPVADASVPVLAELLARFQDETFDRALVSAVEAGVAAERIPSWVPEAVRQLVARRGWRDWGAEIWRRHVADGTLKEIWPAVARDLRLPSVAPAPMGIAEDEDAPRD